MDSSTLVSNPIFIGYCKCVIILSLQMSFVAWTTVYLILSNNGKGIRNQEDLIQGPANPNPHPNQLLPFEPTEKQRRIMNHHIENNLPFMFVGLIYALLQAGTTIPLYAYTTLKILHHIIYWYGHRHELRATIWTTLNAYFLWICYLTWNTINTTTTTTTTTTSQE